MLVALALQQIAQLFGTNAPIFRWYGPQLATQKLFGRWNGSVKNAAIGKKICRLRKSFYAKKKTGENNKNFPGHCFGFDSEK